MPLPTLNALSLVKRLRRQPDANKSHFGKVLLIGGSIGMAGALVLSGKSTLHSGAGWTMLSMLDANSAHALSDQPELMIRDGWITDPASELRHIKPDVVAIGPGLGISPHAEGWLRAVLHAHENEYKPSAIVLDADALHLLAIHADLLTDLRSCPVPCILTPHPGEAARLLGSTNAAIQADRLTSLNRLVLLSRQIVVLKGRHTLLASPSHEAVLCQDGNPALAIGGTGDVLTGLIAALAAQGIAHHLSPWEASCLGVQVHALAADRLSLKNHGPIGATPSELILEIRQTLNDLL